MNEWGLGFGIGFIAGFVICLPAFIALFSERNKVALLEAELRVRKLSDDFPLSVVAGPDLFPVRRNVG